MTQPFRDWAKTHDGKPGISVRQHLLAVAFVAEVLLSRFPHFCAVNRIAAKAVLFLAAVHDAGKISLDFLQKCPTWLEEQGLADEAKNGDWVNLYARPHPRISLESLQLFLQHQGLSSKTAFLWGSVVGAHHGRLTKQYSSRPFRPSDPEITTLENERQQCLAEMWERFGRPVLPEVDKDSPCLWGVAGLITLADWIGSNERFFPPHIELGEDELRRLAAEAVAETGIGLPPVTPGLSFADLFDGKTAYSAQEAIAAAITRPGVYILEAPMGMGKTEAALQAAYHLLGSGQASGLFFALPTQATSNRMFLRLADFARAICPNAAPTQLIHGNSWLHDELKALAVPVSADSGRQADPLWFNTTRRALFAPFGVGTVDQALLAVLAVKHFPLRRFALTGKIVILDEVHTYDVYTGQLVRHLCAELEQLGCTVIILSATLTESARCTLLAEDAQEEEAKAPYPRLTGCVRGEAIAPVCPPTPPAGQGKSVRSHPVRIDHLAIPEARRQALSLAQKGAQVLWVCDTVRQAQDAYQCLREQARNSDVHLGLLHSHFPFFVRERLEQEWLDRFGSNGARDGGAILVSTQVVEQSVDLDADALFSELAPTDMLLQRLGRLWRHPRAARPVAEPFFCLLAESASLGALRTMSADEIRKKLGSKALVYNPYALLRTLEQWAERETLALPQDIRALMAATYADKACPPAWEELWGERYGKETAERTLANMGANIWQQALSDDVRLSTRLSEVEEYSFVLCTEDSGEVLHLLDNSEPVQVGKTRVLSLHTAKALHRNAVKIKSWHFATPDRRPTDERLQAYGLDGCLVLRDNTAHCVGLKSGLRVVWDDALGISINKEGK